MLWGHSCSLLSGDAVRVSPVAVLSDGSLALASTHLDLHCAGEEKLLLLVVSLYSLVHRGSRVSRVLGPASADHRFAVGRIVRCVQLLNVEAVASVAAARSRCRRVLRVDCVIACPLLRVQASVTDRCLGRLNEVRNALSSGLGVRSQRDSIRVESKIGLVHKLLVEGASNRYVTC